MASRISRRNFLKLLLATGGTLLAGKALNSFYTATRTARVHLIKNIIFFIQENHSCQRCADSLPADPPHGHSDTFQPNAATSEAARCSYNESDAPNYWKLARAFTLCDNYFSDVRGPSDPNFLMMIAGQSPIVDAPGPDMCPGFCLDIKALPHRLDAKGLSWRDYGGIFTSVESLVGRPEIMDFSDQQFFVDAAQGTLPNVSWLVSGFLYEADAKSGHPPSSLCVGENYAVQVLNAVMNGPQWGTTAFFLVWDEWGGFYDHVEPPVVERWKDGTPFRYGHRVPCIVVSPYARARYVSHELHSHVSLLRFAETVLNLAPLTKRDAHASDMLDCFDFNQSPLPALLLEPRQCFQ